ncbi:hypothetical protein E2C01_012098 [Portunus trituberculatus]|uniref:Uncharacterized protein n=1 Tax=Portunus trituberculatus TaxID=210409 RepID=A0A5B7DD19_PORTR|nr:hypothetical protein [Portunus trituberculatus]
MCLGALVTEDATQLKAKFYFSQRNIYETKFLNDNTKLSGKTLKVSSLRPSPSPRHSPPHPYNLTWN